MQCVWINACVGNQNQLAFLAFTTAAPVGCLHALLMQLVYLGWTPIPTTRPRGLERTFMFFTLGVTAGVVIAVGLLACLQVGSISSRQHPIGSHQSPPLTVASIRLPCKGGALPVIMPNIGPGETHDYPNCKL